MASRSLRCALWALAALVAGICAVSQVVADGQAVAHRPPKAFSPTAHAGRTLVDAFSGEGTLPGLACASSPELDEILRQRDRLARRAHAWRLMLEDGVDAPGDVGYRDGIWVVEADDTILYGDNPHDLEGQTLRLMPAAGGYDVSLVDESYDGTLGTQVLTDGDAADAVQVDLANFSFPIGSSSYSTLWIDRTLAIRSDDPASAPSPLGFGERQFAKSASTLGGHLLRDQADRLSPSFLIGQGQVARAVWVRDTAEKLLITWRRTATDEGQEFYFDLQAALFPDGSVDYTYRTVRQYANGAPHIFYDLGDWFAGFVQQAYQEDPDDGFLPLAELLSLEVLDDPVSDMMRLRVAVDTTIPETSDPAVTFYLDLKNDGSLIYRYYFEINQGGRSPLYLYTASADAWRLLGSPTTTDDVWEVFASLDELLELDPSLIGYEVMSYEAGSFRDSIAVNGVHDGGMPLKRDISAEAPFSSTAPVIEAFLFPEFNPWAVKSRLLDHTGWDETLVDGIPMYQAFYTELIFYAGAYNTGGNCGAANIGMCDPGEPLSPSLLHMNKTNYGWNNKDREYRFTVISHEQSHHWLQNVLIDEGGGPSNVLNPESAHPAAYVHTEAQADLVAPDDSSVMGGGFWIDNLDGTFTTPPDRTYYSFANYELYLMGLRAPEDVTEWFYIADTDPPQPLSYYPDTDVTVTGDRHDVDINMLLSAMGTRDPLYPNARQDFFTPMVLVVRPGQEPSAADWDFMMSMRHPWRDAFAIQTDGRGSVTTVSPREISPPGASQLLVEKLAGDELRFTFEDPDFSDQVRYNLYEDELGGGFGAYEANTCGEVPGSAGGSLYIDATPTSPASAFFLVTMSNLHFEGEAGEASDGTARSTSATLCGGW